MCPKCQCEHTIKKGKRRNRLQTLQVYECSECLHRFTAGDAGKNKTYPLKTILEALSTFNLGYSLTETQQQLRRRFHREIPERTISSWLTEHKALATYHRLRPTAKKLYGPAAIIRTVNLEHQQVYQFPVLLVDFEMENIRDLKIRTIDQDQIATDHDVRVIRRRRREHHFEFARAGLHFLLESGRQSSANH